MIRSIFAIVLAATAVLATAPATAVTCYLLIDRNGTVVYRDIFPPVDLSDAGASERQALRARNEHMIAMEVAACPRLEFIVGAGSDARLDLSAMGEVPPGISIGSGTESAAPVSSRRPATPPARATPGKSTGSGAAVKN